MKNFKDFFKKHNLSIAIIMTFVFGFAGGLAGGAVARAYLIDPLFGFSTIGDLDFTADRYTGQGLVISNAKNVIVQQDAKVNETISSAASSLVGIYKKKPTPGKAGDNFSLENFYKINEPAGQGFIITSDGWIATSLALVKNFTDYVVITQDKKIYQIDKAAADSLTKFNFIHVQTRDFPVRKFAAIQDIRGGNLAIGVNWLGLNFVSTVAGFSEPAGLVKSSDVFSKRLVLKDKPPSEFKGSVVFNLAGEALAMIDEAGEIEPLSHLEGAVKNLFKNKTNLRSSLGLNYIDLSGLAQIADLPARLAEAPAQRAGQAGQDSRWQKGVVIAKDLKAPAIKKNSPAEKSGLLEGDIIISINRQELNQVNNLGDIVQDYSAGETISLVISRQGVEKEIKVILDELK